MLHLEELILNNFCQHDSRTIEFRRGINLVLGGNGVGKSNALRGVLFALIGESGNEGAKINDLNWQAAENEQGGTVELKFEANGEPAHVRRAIHATRASLKVGDSKRLGSSSAATNRILELSGVSQRIMKDIIFVFQGELESILFERPSDRTKKLQSLFGIENVEKLRQLLHQEAALITTDPTDERIEELKKKLEEEIDPQLRQLNTEQEALKPLLEQDAQKLKECVEAWSKYVADREKAEKLKEQERQLVGAITALGDIVLIETKVAVFQEGQDDRAAEVEEAKAALASMAHARSAAAARAHLQNELERCERTLNEAAPPTPDITWDKINDSLKNVALAKDRIGRTARYLKLFREGKTGFCEFCGQELKFTGQKVAEAENVMSTQPTLVLQVETAIHDGKQMLSEYDTALAQYNERQKEAHEQLERLKAELADQPDVHIPDLDEAHLKDLVKRHEIGAAELAKANQQLEEHRRNTSRNEGELKAVRDQLQELALEPPCTEEEAIAAKDSLTQIDAAKLKEADIGGQLRQLHGARVQTLAELESLKQQAGSMVAKREYKQLCVDARDVLHRDVLPQRVMQQYLSALNYELNRYLQIFNVPFSCEINDELEVVCRIDGFSNKPAARLSGGLRVMLGIAFRFAIYNMFAAKLGFVVLDEPTVWLDDDHISVIADMLTAVRNHVLSSGLQLVVITHRKELRSISDHIIQL